MDGKIKIFQFAYQIKKRIKKIFFRLSQKNKFGNLTGVETNEN